MAATEIERAGQFELLVAELHTSTGLVQDITKNLINIQIWESMDYNSLYGEATIQSQYGLSNIGPIIGQEFLALKFRTPTIDDEKSQMDFSENVFHVRGIADRQSVGVSSEMINIKFVSAELMRNLRTRVSESLKGPISQIVGNMLSRVNCNKDKFIENTIGQIKWVAPNVTPYEVIQSLTPRAISGDASQSQASPTFWFWESMKGIHFRTLDSCIAQQPRWSYTTHESGSSRAKEDVFTELSNLQGFILAANDSMMDHASGMMNSTLITHNTHTKSYTIKEYNYLDNFPKETHIGYGNPLYTGTPIGLRENGTDRFSDGQSKIFLNTTVEDNIGNDPSHLDFAGMNSYRGKNPNGWMQRRHSQVSQIYEGINAKINVWGNSVVSSGDIINIDVPFKSHHTLEDKKFDDFLQGEFLVRAIRHEFDFLGQNHHMEMDCVKDTLPISYEDVDYPIEPIPSIKGDTITDLYETEEPF
tara:strand:- start:245 stop:1666 length:1422 start_codon:yes stop_codon:yes gene_type:complete